MMSLDKPARVIGFAIALGTVVYLASALWSAIFIVSLPMDEDAITGAIEIETGDYQTEWRPIEFKNSLEELKYYHNVRMQERNRYWVYGQIIVGGLLGFLVFYIVPKWRNTLKTQYDPSAIAVGSALAGAMFALIVPAIISWVLPAPTKWFPQEILDIAKTRQKEALSEVESLARNLDAERMYDDP